MGIILISLYRRLIMAFFLILILIILLIFIRVPLKVTIHIDKNDYYLKFFNFIILSPNKGIGNKLIKKYFKKKADKDNESSLSDDEETSPNTPKNKKPKRRKLSITKLYKNITYNRFKPRFKLNGNVNYGLDDAAITAISYGIISNIIPLLIIILSKPFNLKDFNLNINPHFTGDKIFNFTITSILYVSFANIIYMLYLTVISFTKIEEVTPL